jgi:hypothetical protein
MIHLMHVIHVIHVNGKPLAAGLRPALDHEALAIASHP